MACYVLTANEEVTLCGELVDTVLAEADPAKGFIISTAR